MGRGLHLDGAYTATEHSARYGIERRVGNKALLQKEGLEGRGGRDDVQLWKADEKDFTFCAKREKSISRTQFDHEPALQ